MDKFEAIIFDVDGLLLDSEKVSLDTFSEVCEFFNLGNRAELFLSCVGLNKHDADKILRKELSDHVDLESLSNLWNKLYNEHMLSNPLQLKKGALQLLESLKPSGIPLAIATSSESGRAIVKLRNSGIFELFDIIVGGDAVEHGKPEPDIYLRTAELLNVDPKKCLALEDSEAGVLSAYSAGMTVIQVPDLIKPSEKILSLGHIILDDLTELMEYQF